MQTIPFFAFTDKSYCVTKNVFLKIHCKILCFLKRMTIFIHTNCVDENTTRYIEQDIVIVFTMALNVY